MQKVIDWLEKNCQYLAIGAGALFVGYMLYLYVLQPPAHVQIGQDTLTPGKVDEYILTNVGKTLEDKMRPGGSNDNIQLTVPKYVQSFKDAMLWSSAKPVTLPGMLAALPPLPDEPVKAPDGTIVPGTASAVAGAPQADRTKVTELPVIPGATPAEYKFGRSLVLLPPAPGQPAPPPPTPGQPVVGGVDKDWVTQLFHVNIADIDKAFTKSRIPADFYKTAFLQVELQREELDDAGKPVPNTQQIIKPLDVSRGATPPPPFPADDAARDAQLSYMTWATTNTPDIIEPLFYTWAKGDQWAKPGTQVAAAVIFDPKMYLTGQIPAWATPEQKNAIMAERAAETKRKADEKIKNRPAPRAPSHGGGLQQDLGGGAPPGGFRAPRVEYAPAPAPSHAPAPARPTRPPVGGDGIGPPPGSIEAQLNGGAPPGIGGYPGGPTPAALPQPGTDFPNGEFNPSEAVWKTKSIDVWAHDETVVASKSYRYRIRYKIKNPVWAAGNVTDPETLANQFALSSEWSGWSSTVNIPPLINFFVKANRSLSGMNVQFEVFKWDQGAQKSATFSVAPGDQIGGTKDGVDFTTDWVVVDFRQDPRQNNDWQFLLINSKTGKVVTRSYNTDRSDDLYKGLKEQITQNKATETAASGAPGGSPPVLH